MSDVRFTATVAGQERTSAMLRNASRGAERNLISLVKQEGRGLAVELARATRTPGFSGAAKARGEKAVFMSVNRVFCLPSDVYGEIRKTDRPAADRFWANVQEGKFGKARKALQGSNSAWSALSMGRVNPAIHQANRNAYGWVPRMKPVHIVNTEAARTSYANKVAKKVGFAKGVWINAAKAIGGRVRNAAQWVSRHKQAPGTAIVRSGPKASVTLVSRLDYMDDVLGWKATEIALAAAGSRLRKALAISIQKIRDRRRG